MNDTLMIAKEYTFDRIYDEVYLRLKHVGYDPNIGYEITFNPELEIYVATLPELGYDMNDDETTFFDENGRPCICPASESAHWLGDLSMLDENGERIPNVEYIKEVVEGLFKNESLITFTAG